MAVRAYVTYASTTVSYYDFSDANVRCFLDTYVDGKTYDNKRFHPVGADGNFVIRGGYTGQPLQLKVRYKAKPLNDAVIAWKADVDAFSRQSVLVNDGITSWGRCTLQNGSGKRLGDERSQGYQMGGSFDVMYTFDVEESY